MGTVIPFRATDQWEVLRRTRQHIAEAWRMKAESAGIKRRYEERQKQIEVLLASLEKRWSSGA